MFDSYSRNSYNNPQTVNINAVGGTIVKNYKDSFILRFHMKSKMADMLLDKNPELTRRKIYHPSDYMYRTGHTEEIKEPVVVLQVMLCGDQELLAEVMWKEDFDKMYEPLKMYEPQVESEELTDIHAKLYTLSKVHGWSDNVVDDIMAVIKGEV